MLKRGALYPVLPERRPLPVWAGAWRLCCSQLVGGAGPGGGLAVPPGTLRVRVPAPTVSSSLCSGVGRDACSRRSCWIRAFTDGGSEGPDGGEDRVLWREG